MTVVNKFLASTLNLDDDGFLRQPEIWTRDVAQLLAQGEVPGDLTEDHWKVVDYLRRYYLEFDGAPPVRMLRRDTGFNLQSICRLFPSGLTKGACRIAGIPRIRIHPLYP